jgi:hypothetical protein
MLREVRVDKILIMQMKVQIHNAVLRGQSQDWVLQRVASVYEGEIEYRVYGPARAQGDALEWVEQFTVRQLSESGQGENNVDDRMCRIVVEQVKDHLENHKLDSDIWTSGNDSARFYSGQICQNGHVQSSDGKNPVSKGEHCQRCGSPIIVHCPHCNAPIRGQDVFLAADYARPSFCYKCGQPYPWQEDRLNTARELLYHDDKLTQDDREKLWDLLKEVMSNPTDDLVPAKRRLIDFKLAKAGQMTKDLLTDLIAKTMAEIIKP